MQTPPEIITPCMYCAIQDQLKGSCFFATRGMDWPTTVVGGRTVHKACASTIQAHVYDIEHGRVIVSSEGIARWVSNGHAVPAESAAILHGLDLVLDIGATAAAEEAETHRALAAYRAFRAEHGYSEVEKAEMRAAFGDDNPIDVITGRVIQL